MSWALELDPADAGSLGGLRLEPGLEVCEEDARLWLRGPERSGLARRLLRLPARARYAVREGALVPLGARLPTGRLPGGRWEPLGDWLQLDPGPAALPAELPAPVTLQVLPARAPAAGLPGLLLTAADGWRRWAETASELRLRRLRFALDRQGRALIRGEPLPPLPGERWVEAEGVAVPCGYAWSPALDAATCAVVLGLLPGDLALLHPDGDWERLDASAFVAATRAAVRGSAPGA